MEESTIEMSFLMLELNMLVTEIQESEFMKQDHKALVQHQ